MIGRFFSNRYGITVIGPILVLIGIFAFSSSEVKCGSQVMQPGDTCTETRKGRSTTRDYDEQKSRDQMLRWGFIGVGSVLFLVGAGLIVKRHAGGGSRDQQAAAGGPPVPPQPYGAPGPQQYPPQPYGQQPQYPQQPQYAQYPQQVQPPQQHAQYPPQGQYPSQGQYPAHQYPPQQPQQHPQPGYPPR